MTARMHVDELEIDEALVRRLLANQFPEWADLPLRRIEPSGTVNAIFRLGRSRSYPDRLAYAAAASSRRSARDLGGPVRAERRDHPALGIVVAGDEGLGGPLEIDGGSRIRAADELEPQAELIGPEEVRLGGLRRQGEDPACDGGGFGGRARPVAGPARDVAAGEDRRSLDRARHELRTRARRRCRRARRRSGARCRR